MLLDENSYHQHCDWMAFALTLAKQSGEQGEIPVGAVIVDAQQNLISQASNRKQRDRDPTAHAEIIAIRWAAQQLGDWHLNDCTLYVTLEPCPMCSGAIIQSRLGIVVYGADDPKTGALRTVINLVESAASNHHPTVIGGILETNCRQILQHWFANKRVDDRN